MTRFSCLATVIAFTLLSTVRANETESSVHAKSLEALTRECMQAGLDSSDSKTRSRVIDIVADRGARYSSLLDAFDRNSATEVERLQIARARTERLNVPVDAAEFQAFEYFKRLDVTMDVANGHVTGFTTPLNLGRDACEKLLAFEHLERCGFGSREMSLEAYAVIKQLPNLKSVSLLNATSPIADTSLEYAATLPNLADLSIPERITDRGMAALREKTTIRFLMIRSKRMTDQGMMEIKDCIGLENLQVTTVLNDRSVDALVNLPNLATLRLDSCPITDRGVAKLAVLPNLEDLVLGRCVWVEGASLEALAAAPKLRILNLPPSVGVEHLVHLQDFPVLEHFECSSRFLDDRVVDMLISCPKLVRVQISRGSISDAGVERLLQHFGELEKSKKFTGVRFFAPRKPVVYQN